MNWDRFDTLLARIVLLAGFAVIACLALVYVVVSVQMDRERRTMASPQERVSQTVSALQQAGWPEQLPHGQMRTLRLKAYSLSETPQHRPMQMREGSDGERPPEPFGSPRPGRPPPEPSDRGEPRETRDSRPRREEDFAISVETGSGMWANISFLHPKPPWSGLRFWSAVLIFILMVLIAAWGARNASRPIQAMAASARSLATDFSYKPIEERGPSDVRRALHAFNLMGRRLEKTVEGQRQLLEAIGHDLRTPITSLRLKIEMLSDPNERQRMERAIVELERITEAALVAASAGRSTSPFQKLDLTSLVDSLCDDLSAMGSPVEWAPPEERIIVLGRSDELVRALRNLIENAVRYGDRARVSLFTTGNWARIRVDDDGPGIPEDALQAVFEPLVRLERSRNKETGGHGLGLHITRNIIEAHEGQITLANREDGGLRVEVSLALEG